ncbi:IPMK (predicted) [Pycnogonum litorale]
MTSAFPEGTMQLSHQIAGHKHHAKQRKLGMLKHEDGSILKPVSLDIRGERELQFYVRLFESNPTDDELTLRNFVPPYLGVFKTSFQDNDVTYLKLKDVSSRYTHPCIMDVKIGPRTYDPLATPDKIIKEMNKYPPVTSIGFRILGYRIYDGKDDVYKLETAQYFKTLTDREMVIDALKYYFGSCSNRLAVIRNVLKGLRTMLNWFDNQRSYNFYSSSVLMVYESDDVPDRTDVKMIDFAHVYNSTEIDENYIYGLTEFDIVFGNVVRK